MWSNGGMDGGLVASGAQRSTRDVQVYVVAWSIVSLSADAETVKIFKSTSGGFARANETSPAPLSRIPRKSGFQLQRIYFTSTHTKKEEEQEEEEEEEGIRKFIFVDERSELEKERRDSEKTRSREDRTTTVRMQSAVVEQREPISESASVIMRMRRIEIDKIASFTKFDDSSNMEIHLLLPSFNFNLIRRRSSTMAKQYIDVYPSVQDPPERSGLETLIQEYLKFLGILIYS
ncbi:hypothetical protein V1478_011943 [Vespula squamosa]|uniref:Uncharacterized protein n=1 Tax=Vespula squamosa TaxID=30214 RepID=A0ABD2ABT4_VESSQ